VAKKLPSSLIYKNTSQSKQSPNRRKIAQSGHPDPLRLQYLRTIELLAKITATLPILCTVEIAGKNNNLIFTKFCKTDV
jgi:hypothetical protein